MTDPHRQSPTSSGTHAGQSIEESLRRVRPAPIPALLEARILAAASHTQRDSNGRWTWRQMAIAASIAMILSVAAGTIGFSLGRERGIALASVEHVSGISITAWSRDREAPTSARRLSMAIREGDLETALDHASASLPATYPPRDNPLTN